MKSVVKIYEKRPSVEQEDIKLTIAKVKVEMLDKKSNTKSYNKAVTDVNFGWHKDLSTLKCDIHFFGLINPYVNLNEINICFNNFSVVKKLFFKKLLPFRF